jgi:hypothetical protein
VCVVRSGVRKAEDFKAKSPFLSLNSLPAGRVVRIGRTFGSAPFVYFIEAIIPALPSFQ